MVVRDIRMKQNVTKCSESQQFRNTVIGVIYWNYEWDFPWLHGQGHVQKGMSRMNGIEKIKLIKNMPPKIIYLIQVTD